MSLFGGDLLPQTWAGEGFVVNETASLPLVLSGGGANNKQASKQILNYLPGQEVQQERRGWGGTPPTYFRLVTSFKPHGSLALGDDIPMLQMRKLRPREVK